MEKSAVFKMVLEYFKENEDEFNDIIEDLDNYNGYLGDDRYYEMDELAEFYLPTFNWSPYSGRNSYQDARDAFNNLLNRIYFGHDADSWNTDSHGEKEYGAFNPLRSYYTYNGYGNLVSTDSKNYSYRLDEYFIETLFECKDHVSLPTEVDDLFEMVEG